MPVPEPVPVPLKFLELWSLLAFPRQLQLCFELFLRTLPPQLTTPAELCPLEFTLRLTVAPLDVGDFGRLRFSTLLHTTLAPQLLLLMCFVVFTAAL